MCRCNISEQCVMLKLNLLNGSGNHLSHSTSLLCGFLFLFTRSCPWKRRSIFSLQDADWKKTMWYEWIVVFDLCFWKDYYLYFCFISCIFYFCNVTFSLSKEDDSHNWPQGFWNYAVSNVCGSAVSIIIIILYYWNQVFLSIQKDIFVTPLSRT